MVIIFKKLLFIEIIIIITLLIMKISILILILRQLKYLKKVSNN